MTGPDPVAVWAIWNGLPDTERSPVHVIARQLGVRPREVAAIVYPDGYGFRKWADTDEPAGRGW